MARHKKPKISPEQRVAAEQRWAKLEEELNQEMMILGQSRLQAGRILYEMKRLLKQWGFLNGRRGRWKAVCDRHEIDRRSAENWIWKWQQYNDIPEDEWVVHHKNSRNSDTDTEITQEDCENNTVKVTGLARADIIAPNDDDHDKSNEKRSAIECIFVLTMAEKIAFMDAVKALSPLRATQEMYKAVINAAGVQRP